MARCKPNGSNIEARRKVLIKCYIMLTVLIIKIEGESREVPVRGEPAEKWKASRKDGDMAKRRKVPMW